MLKRIVEKKMQEFEAMTGESADYMREIYAASPKAFFKYNRFSQGMGQHRDVLPPEVAAVAGIAAIKSEDCGPCLMIVIRFAQLRGVGDDVIEAAVARDLETLSPDLADAYRFAEAVAGAEHDTGELEDKLRAQYGDRGMIELAFVIASVRVYPTLKRALGHGRACYPVEIGGKVVPVGFAPEHGHEHKDTPSHGDRAAALA